MDTVPGHYQLSFQTKNNIFVRSINKPITVLPGPVHIQEKVQNNDRVRLHVLLDKQQINLASVVIYGEIKDQYSDKSWQVISNATSDEYSIHKTLDYSTFIFTSKMAATTIDAREIVITLPERWFTLTAPVKNILQSDESESLALPADIIEESDFSLFSNFWFLGGILLLVILLIAIFIVALKKIKANQIVNVEE